MLANPEGRTVCGPPCVFTLGIASPPGGPVSRAGHAVPILQWVVPSEVLEVWLLPSIAAERNAHGRAAWTLLALVCVFSMLGAPTAHAAVSRATVIARAQTWMDRFVPYSQKRYYAGYRTDCSGYVSMCWQTSSSWSTSSFHNKAAYRISVGELQPGDALHKVGHIRLFYGWVDEAHTMYVAYEQTSANSLFGAGTQTNIKYIANDLAAGYHPCRRVHITGSVTSPSLLKNGSLDVWARSLTTWDYSPVWWDLKSSSDTTLAVRRTDTVAATRSSVQLNNPSSRSSVVTSMTQTVAVAPQTPYFAYAWARTGSDPAGLELRLDYLDASGAQLLTTSVRGDAAGLNDTAFKPLSLTAASPQGAAKARVTLRLQGGTTPLGAGETTAGTSAVIDEIALLRPQSSIGIARSASHSHRKKTVTLSGSVSTAAAAGASYSVYARRPGSKKWIRVYNGAAYASGSGAAWRHTYRFKKTAKKGIYHFKVVLSDFGGWLGSTSGAVHVRVK